MRNLDPGYIEKLIVSGLGKRAFAHYLKAYEKTHSREILREILIPTVANCVVRGITNPATLVVIRMYHKTSVEVRLGEMNVPRLMDTKIQTEDVEDVLSSENPPIALLQLMATYAVTDVFVDMIASIAHLSNLGTISSEYVE